MRNYLPVLWLAEELPPQSSAQDKLGGRPWGLPASLWPECRECGGSQSLLAQFVHDPIRLDLGRAGRVLSVFQCSHDPGMCENWDASSGANACFVSEPEDLIDALSVVPSDSPPLEREARILEWRVRDDGLSEKDAARFYDYDTHLDIPEEICDRVTPLTRLGGVPSWVQGAAPPSGDGWRFIGQLADGYSFFRTPTVEVDGVEACPELYEGRSHHCEGPIFGGSGTGYIFLRDGRGVPESCFFWQC